METYSFNLKPPLTDVSTPSSHFHKIYIILHHLPSQVYQGEDKKSIDSQTGQNSEFLGKIGKTLPDAQCREPDAQCFL